jgi:hypothetical protein
MKKKILSRQIAVPVIFHHASSAAVVIPPMSRNRGMENKAKWRPRSLRFQRSRPATYESHAMRTKQMERISSHTAKKTNPPGFCRNEGGSLRAYILKKKNAKTRIRTGEEANAIKLSSVIATGRVPDSMMTTCVLELEIKETAREPASLPPRAQPPKSSPPPAAAHDASSSSPPFRGTPSPCSSASARSLLPRPT